MSAYQRMTKWERISIRLSIFRDASPDLETYEACVAYVAKTMGLTFSQLKGELHAFYLSAITGRW